MNAPTWDPKAPVVPVMSDGSLQHYPSGTWRGRERLPIQWRAWEPFTDGLRFEGFSRGRSAAYALLSHEDHRVFPTMLADLEDFLKRGQLVRGRLTPPLGLVWAVRKRGANYGVRLSDG